MNFKKRIAAMLTLGILFTSSDYVLAVIPAEQASLQESQEIKLSADNYKWNAKSIEVSSCLL